MKIYYSPKHGMARLVILHAGLGAEYYAEVTTEFLGHFFHHRVSFDNTFKKTNKVYFYNEHENE